MALEVSFYRTRAGTEPVRRWLKTLTPEARRELGRCLRIVQQRWPVGMPLVRHPERELWELRVPVSGVELRLLFTISGAAMLVLHGLIKKSRELPNAELDLARRNLKESRNV